MSAGTIILTNGSAIVGGSGTSFSTELAAGDFIVSTVGGVSYTLPVKSVEGNTQLTLVSNFTGPTQSGAAWSAVPRVALNMVTAALVAQSAEALRGLNYDKQNWQQVYSAAGNITVKLPDGTTFTGPSWKYMSDNMNTVNGKSGGTISSPVAVNPSGGVPALTLNQGKTDQGQPMTNHIELLVADGYNPNPGFYANSIKGYWFGTGTYWQLGGARGGGANLQSIVMGLKPDNQSNPVNWQFNANGQAIGTWVNNSDQRIKKDIVAIPEPLEAMKKLRGYSWLRLDSGIMGFGFVAQEVEKVFPEAVSNFGQTMTLEDGTVVENVLSVDTTGVSAALHHEAILALMERVDELIQEIEFLKAGS